jgi:membrane fusion protein (multidrug efflux system)
MIKRMILMLAAVGLVLGLIFGFQVFKAKMIKQALAALSSPPQTVSTIQATEQEWRSQLEAVGSLRAVRGSDLSPQVAGTVSALHFDSGMDVKEGTLLVELASADDVAKLQSLKANSALAKLTYDRDLRQLNAQAVSQQTVDNDLQTWRSDEALVAQQQATLDYKLIRAPFAGHLGIRLIDLGQYLAAGTVMVTLQALDPIYADFYLPQQALDQVRVGQTVTVKIDTYPGKEFPGEISAIDARVDTATRPTAALRYPAADRDRLQFLRQHGLSRRGQGQGRHGQAAAGSPPELRQDRGDARRPGVGRERRQAGRRRRQHRSGEVA